MKFLVKVVEDEHVVQFRTTAKTLPRFGEFYFLETDEDLTHPIVNIDEDGNKSLVEDPAHLLADQVTDLYNGMVDDVYSEMEGVFGTRNDVSATAFASTWEAMLKRPGNYIAEELGLTTEEEVIAYATAKIDQADQYGIYRMKRIGKFTADKEALLTVVAE